METGDIIVLILCLVASGFFVAMGIPCGMGWVRPNRLYGFRTRKTLQDPDVWYPTNRVAGYWGVATGIVAAGVSISTFFAGLGLPAAALVNLVPFAWHRRHSYSRFPHNPASDQGQTKGWDVNLSVRAVNSMGRTVMLVWLQVATVVLTGIGAGRYFVHYAKTKDKGSLVGACCFLVPCVIFTILALYSAGVIDFGWLARSN